MVQGSDPYQLTMGTLGGYVMVYDIRYNVISSVFRHSLNYPILSLATYKKRQEDAGRKSPLVMVSAGAPSHELSTLNLETGAVEMLFKCSSPDHDKKLSSGDMPTVPWFIRETKF
jgi:hypothetical protein